MALQNPEQIYLLKPRTVKQNKYHSIRTEIDGITFHSKAEAARWVILLEAQRLGAIERLERQPCFKFPTGVKYFADFRYWDKAASKSCVEDVKGKETQLFIDKIKAMKFYFPDVEVIIIKIESRQADMLVRAYLGAKSVKAKKN